MNIELGKYQNKKILIIGGGTSTLDVKWENLEYDFVWTCNDFYLENRVYNQHIDLYLLAHTTDLSNKKLKEKLKKSDITIFYEPVHYRGKQNTLEFKQFEKEIQINIKAFNIPKIIGYNGHGQKSGAVFRLIILALMTEASEIMFVGFDGFNQKFSNKHAFTKHIGLKPTDTRRTWKGSNDSYYEIFIDAYQTLAKVDTDSRLQNLGEGLEYNIGTPISKTAFPLTEKIYKKLI